MNEAGRSVRLTIPAKPEYITLGRLALTGLAGVRPVSDETLYDLKLALTEACTNSVRHAYENGREGSVEIVYELQPDRLVVEVGDEGAGFEPVDGGNGHGDEVEGGGGGLGTELSRAPADEVEIGRREEGGSRLRFVKFLAE